MTAESAALVRSWQVGERTCTLTVPRSRAGRIGAAAIEWTPDRPMKMSAGDWTAYRAGRNAALDDLARELGGAIALVEV